MRPAAELIDRSQAEEVAIYEQPLNERMRTFLRLDFLFNQAEFHASGDSPWQSRAAVSSLLDVLAILGRGDVRQEVVKELERHGADLLQYRAQPGVDRTRLDNILDKISNLLKGLELSGITLAQRLKESEFLSSVKHRSAIPGGTCEFDLPDYCHWLHLPFEQRRRDFDDWMTILRPLRNGLSEVLWLLRESAQPRDEVARAGMFQHVLERGVAAQLLRIGVPAGANVYPEISGSQHRFTVRFYSWHDIETRPVQSTDDVAFSLSCC